MQLKANAWREPEPIPATELGIAKLARGKAAASVAVEPADAPAPYVTVALHRERLGITQVGGYFTLKMRLVRTLRRGFRSSIIEVDDSVAPPDCDAELFRVSVEPADPQAYARAVRTVRRVLRSRHAR